MYPPGLSLSFLNTQSAVFSLREELQLIGGLDDSLDDLQMSRVNSRETTPMNYQEALGVTIQILSWADRDAMLITNGLSLEFAEQDFLDRISDTPVNPGMAVGVDQTGVIKPYLEDDGKFSYTYSERMNPQLDHIITLLKETPNTRQAFLGIWDITKDPFKLETKRVPCSIGYHFFIRDKSLHLLYLMRSLCVDRNFGYDIYTSSRLLEYIAEAVGVEAGFLQFWVGSIHNFVGIGGVTDEKGV